MSFGCESIQISCFPVGFKIRKKSDISTFMGGLGEGSWYYDRGDAYDWCIEKEKRKESYISKRHKDARGNIFMPYFEVARSGQYVPKKETLENIIWRDRKYINNQIIK